MKYIFCNFFLILILSFTTYAQKGEITSSNQIKVIYEYSHSISEETTFDVLLYFTESNSQYVYHSERKKVKLDGGLTYTSPFHSYFNNYNFNNKDIEENRILDNGTTLYATWNNNLVWEISDEEKIIGNYRVRKATTESIELDRENPFYAGKVTAWFCPDIPIPSGPARYYGLPGLIIELKYQKDGGSYRLKSIEEDDDYKFKEITTKNQVDKEDVIYYNHKNPQIIKELKKNKK